MLKGWLGKRHQYQSKRISGCTVGAQRNKKVGYPIYRYNQYTGRNIKNKNRIVELYGKITKKG